MKTRWNDPHKRERASWGGMWDRCSKPHNKDWPRYGGRGITVTLRWRHFETFLADMGPRPEGTTLDRIDNDGHYTPSNCRWATPLEQDNNRRSNRRITFKGETKTLAEWARAYGAPYLLVFDRLSDGWSLEKSLTTAPTRARGDGVNTSKLNAEQVVAIRAERAAGISLPKLAAKYAVSAQSIWKICRREYWRHIP